MKTDTKHGFIVTYYRSSEESEQMLRNMIDVLSKENFYLVLAAHSLVPTDIQEKCDFFIYESLNISDNRRYSHGVAESSLIEMSMQHLKYQKIDWTFKTCYDVIINDTSQFREVVKNYQYPLVTCNWGDTFICTHTFFTNVDFILDNITFYRTVEEMFEVSNILEICWEKDILNKNLKDKIYIYPSKAELLGGFNKIDTIGYQYYDVEFWFEESEDKFYVKNNGEKYSAELRIFDYYSDTLVYVNKNFEQEKGSTHWIISPVVSYLNKSKNGFYLEIYLDSKTITKNILIKDFRLKDPNSKRFKLIKRNEVKFNEYCDFMDFSLYESYGIKKEDIKNYVDIGACYGFASLPFINTGTKIYMIEPDKNNIEILNKLWSKNRSVIILENAISKIDGKINFYIEEDLSVVSSIYDVNALGNREGRKSVEVSSITPDNLIENYIEESEIDLMKVDIEGAEYDFFEHISEDNLNKCKRLIIEFHNNEEYKVMNILKKLAKNGFKYKLSKWKADDSEFIIENKMGIIYASK